MKKILFSFSLVVLLAVPGMVSASVTASASALVVSSMALGPSSLEIPVFSIMLAQTAGETLSSVAVTINNNGNSTVSGADFAFVRVYKDSNANGIFDASNDALAGTQTVVNVGSSTTVTTTVNNALDGGKFFVTIATSVSWNGTVEPNDSITITLAGNAVVTSANSPTISSALTTGIIMAVKKDRADKDDNDEDSRKVCPAGIRNGRLIKIKGSPTVYLVVSCKLRPFRGAAVFHARGHKFVNIVELDSLPGGIEVSQRPALPAGGTLVRGDQDKTVWFITKEGKRRGFTREEVFRRLGFLFDRVELISQSDLDTMEVDANIDAEDKHPDGALIKCGNATAVFRVHGGMKEPFTSSEAFSARGHQFGHILSVDCTKFSYSQGAVVE